MGLELETKTKKTTQFFSGQVTFMRKNSEKQVLPRVVLHLPLTLTSLSFYLIETKGERARGRGRGKREEEREGERWGETERQRQTATDRDRRRHRPRDRGAFFIGIRYNEKTNKRLGGLMEWKIRGRYFCYSGWTTRDANSWVLEIDILSDLCKLQFSLKKQDNLDPPCDQKGRRRDVQKRWAPQITCFGKRA